MDYQITLRDIEGNVLMRLNASFLAQTGKAAIDIGPAAIKVASIQVTEIEPTIHYEYAYDAPPESEFDSSLKELDYKVTRLVNDVSNLSVRIDNIRRETLATQHGEALARRISVLEQRVTAMADDANLAVKVASTHSHHED